MKIDLNVEKNVLLKRDKPWSRFWTLNDQSLLCFNHQKKLESVDCRNGKIDHISNKTISNGAKSSVTHASSKNGQYCAFLSSTYDVLIWDKDKSIRTIPPDENLLNAVKYPPSLFISNSGENIILICRNPCRIFIWTKPFDRFGGLFRLRTKNGLCSQVSTRSMDQTSRWREISLDDQRWLRFHQNGGLWIADVFFRPKQASVLCAFVFVDDSSNQLVLNRLEIDWKTSVYDEQPLNYSLEIFETPLVKQNPLNQIRFAQNSPILAISLSTQIVFISMTTLTFSKSMDTVCTSINKEVTIADLAWSSDDQFLVGLTTRGALFFVQRFGHQIDIKTQGDCISQGPAPYIIFHPLIGVNSEATNHLGLDAFFRSISVAINDEKHKEQVYSITTHPTKPWIFCSDGYRLISLTYSESIRDRRLYDPLLYLYVLDLNRRENHAIHLDEYRSTEDLPNQLDYHGSEDNGSIGIGANYSQRWKTLKNPDSLTLNPIDDEFHLTIGEILSAYELHFTSSERVQHELCLCLERTTKSLVLSSKEDLFTLGQLSHFLNNLVLTSSFGSVNALHLTCLAKMLPLFTDLFEQQNKTIDRMELFNLSLLFIIEQWLQVVSHLPTQMTTFEIVRPRKLEMASHIPTAENILLCKATRQLELLQGAEVNVDEFLSSRTLIRDLQQQEADFRYNRLTLLNSWYNLWSSVEFKCREMKRPPQYLLTIRIFLQSLLSCYPSLNTIRLVRSSYATDLNDVFPALTSHTDQLLSAKSYKTLDERRKQRRRPQTQKQQTSTSQTKPARASRRTKPISERRKSTILHRVLYVLIEQYQIRDALCVLNVALKRETSQKSSFIPLDLFDANLFQSIDTRTTFGLPGAALQSVLRSLARFMARSMILPDSNDPNKSLFIYSVDSVKPLPNIFQFDPNSTTHKSSRIIFIDRHRLNAAIEQQKMRPFWQPLKVIELFVLGHSIHEAIYFAKAMGDWRAAVCLASTIVKDPRKSSVINPMSADALLYTKLCEHLQIDNLKNILKQNYTVEEILGFVKQLPTIFEQFFRCATLLEIPIVEMLFKRLNAMIIYLFTLLPTFITPKFYLPCPPIYQSILNTYDDENVDLNCKYEIRIRLIFYRTVHIIIKLLSASRIQNSCIKWYLDHLMIIKDRRKSSKTKFDENFRMIQNIASSLRFDRLPNIPDRILLCFRHFCTMLFLMDVRDRLSSTLRQYIKYKIQMKHESSRLPWKIIEYATILLSFRCLVSDEMSLLRTVLNLFFDLPLSEQVIRALATLVSMRSTADRRTHINDEVDSIINRLKAKWSTESPTFLHLYEDILQNIVVKDVQEDIIGQYINEDSDRESDVQFDLKAKSYENSPEFAEFMAPLLPFLHDQAPLDDLNRRETSNHDLKFDAKSIPLLSSMTKDFREFELLTSLDKRFMKKQLPNFIPPSEYVVFPVRVVEYDNQRTMFRLNPAHSRGNTIGSFVHQNKNEHPPDVITLDSNHQHDQNSRVEESNTYSRTNDATTWDGRSNDPSRSYIRQFDPPYDEDARQAIWMSQWNQQPLNVINERPQNNAMRVPLSAQTIISTRVLSDSDGYENALRRNEKLKSNYDNSEQDSNFTDVTKDNDDEIPPTLTELASSPRRPDFHPRKNSLDESMSIPLMSTDGQGDFYRNHDYRAPSRETIADDTPTYDIADFPTTYYGDSKRHNNQLSPRHGQSQLLSPPTSNGFQQQQQQPNTLRLSLNDRRLLEDIDPSGIERRELEERDRYATGSTHRTDVSRNSSNGRHSSRRESPHRLRHSPDSHDRQSPTRRSSRNHSPRREHSSRRSPTRHDSKHYTDHHGHQHSQIPHHYPNPNFHGASTQPASFRLPLLQLRNPWNNQGFVAHYQTSPSLPIPRLPTFTHMPTASHVATTQVHSFPQSQMALPVQPLATFSSELPIQDNRMNPYGQQLVQRYIQQHRPRLQLLQLRFTPPSVSNPKPETTITTVKDFEIPMPAPNVLATSTEKSHTAVQVDEPRRDGFVIEPDTFKELLRKATGVNFTSAEAHYSAARLIQEQALEARRRERSTMTDLPAYQILYDLQYSRGGTGDDRKFFNVTDIPAEHVDPLLAQIRRDQIEREKGQIQEAGMHDQTGQSGTARSHLDREQNTNQSTIAKTVYRNGSQHVIDQIEPTSSRANNRGAFVERNTGACPQEPTRPTSNNEYIQNQHSSGQSHTTAPQPDSAHGSKDYLNVQTMVDELHRQRNEEEERAFHTAFGQIEGNKSNLHVTYDSNAKSDDLENFDVPLENLLIPSSSREQKSDRSTARTNHLSVRSNKSPRKKPTPAAPIRIKTTVPRDPFTPRRATSESSMSTTRTPRKTVSPTIADRHREARLKKLEELSKARDRNTLEFVKQALNENPLPTSHALDEFELEALETSFTSTVRELAGSNRGAINRTYDLDLFDDQDEIDNLVSDILGSRPGSSSKSARDGTRLVRSNSLTSQDRPGSASSTSKSRTMTPMGKAILQVKKGPPPARSNNLRKRPMSSPANMSHQRQSKTAPVFDSQPRQRLVPKIRKASPPAHKATTYHDRVRTLNKTDSEIHQRPKPDPNDPKALMRLYGTRRVPGLYRPYERTEPRVVKTYTERMQNLQKPTSARPQRFVQTLDDDIDAVPRPSSAPSSSTSISEWEVDDRIKQLLADENDTVRSRQTRSSVAPLENLEEMADEDFTNDTISLTGVTEQTNENTYGDDLRSRGRRRSSAQLPTHYFGTRASARSSAGGDMTARDESEFSRGGSSVASYIDWSHIDKEFGND